MKKIFITTFGIFVLAIALSFQTNNNDLILNTAFALQTCCPEDGSVCCSEGYCITGYYLLEGSGCKATSLRKNLTP
jgi:hypothetical protein